MANALLALVSNSRNVNPYFAICQKTISGATSRWSFFLPFWAVYSRGVRGGGRLFAQLTTCREDLSNKPFSRECWGSPYFAFAQYGLLVALFRFRSIRALGRPISLSLNTGSIYGYVLGPGPLRAYASAPHPSPRPHGAGHRSPAAFAHRVPIPSNGGLCQRVQLYSLYIIIW